ncbi:cardio acceleratory peptide 2b isoform X1 [Drosophila nasuta]|uniref:cardio acceleratory peptide 2b isoform X1 n=1 Tax=Drosophila nasuta TaxID=42062 RepID=UPI00295E7DD9|nr:cardio acceleratory peptide 2b isoform X1 [Drosophila nasuta]
MKSFSCAINIAYTILLLVLLTKFGNAAFFKPSGTEQDNNKIRRGANMGLYTFPRVGRSDPSLASNLHDAGEALAFESIYGLNEASSEDFDADYQKRGGFVSFPHMGRNEAEIRKLAHLLALQQALDKRTGPSASSGLWFGPRLGKRSVDAKDYAAATKSQKEIF